MRRAKTRLVAMEAELEILYTDVVDDYVKLNIQDKKILENIIKVAGKILKHEKKNTKTMYEYFVTHELINALGLSVNGSIYIELPKKIDSAEDITKLEKDILELCANPMMKSVCITNFILLKEYEVEIEDKALLEM